MVAAAGLAAEESAFEDATMLGAPNAELAVAVGVLKMFSAVAGAAKIGEVAAV